MDGRPYPCKWGLWAGLRQDVGSKASWGGYHCPARGVGRKQTREARPIPTRRREGLEWGFCCGVPEGQAGPRPLLSGLLKHKALRISLAFHDLLPLFPGRMCYLPYGAQASALHLWNLTYPLSEASFAPISQMRTLRELNERAAAMCPSFRVR